MNLIWMTQTVFFLPPQIIIVSERQIVPGWSIVSIVPRIKKLEFLLHYMMYDKCRSCSSVFARFKSLLSEQLITVQPAYGC